MWNPRQSRVAFVWVVLAIWACGAVGRVAVAQADVAPSQVLDNYLVGLTNGDQRRIAACIAGPMAQKSRRRFAEPEAYSQFLRRHYAGVQVTVGALAPRGDGFQARVRFDFPESDSSTVVFTLERMDGRWKIVDEQF